LPSWKKKGEIEHMGDFFPHYWEEDFSADSSQAENFYSGEGLDYMGDSIGEIWEDYDPADYAPSFGDNDSEDYDPTYHSPSYEEDCPSDDVPSNEDNDSLANNPLSKKEPPQADPPKVARYYQTDDFPF
jgi:hypothetical protein